MWQLLLSVCMAVTVCLRTVAAAWLRTDNVSVYAWLAVSVTICLRATLTTCLYFMCTVCVCNCVGSVAVAAWHVV